jgi:hypothetical protein
MQSDEVIKARLDRLDNHIRFEFELTFHRLNYVAIAESFLFAAYATALSIKCANKDVVPIIERMLTAIPIIGIAAAFIVWLSNFSTIHVIHALKSERRRRCLGRARRFAIDPCIDDLSVPHDIGLLPPIVVTTSFIAAWRYLAFAEGLNWRV